MNKKCLKPNQDWTGVFIKYESGDYRKECESCERGYHGNRWDAHHVLPGTVFGQITDPFIHECLATTNYNINKAYSMAGLPKLTAFILYFQKDATMPYEREKERTVTMRRWGTVRQYKSQAPMPVTFPGNLPVHNPCNWGHTDYNLDVKLYLEKNVWMDLRKKRDNKEHFGPEQVRQLLDNAQKHFWKDLEKIGGGKGGGGCIGVEENLRHRYGKAKDGWWKPMCMSRKVTSAPASSSLGGGVQDEEEGEEE